MQFSFTKVGTKTNGRDDWGVRVVADAPGGAIVFAGKDVEVRKRDGATRDVTLGDLVDAKDGGKTATYSLKRRDNGNTGGPSAVEAITKIALVLHTHGSNGKTWTRGTLDEVADLVAAYGLPVTKPAVKKPAATKKPARARKAA